MFKKVDKQKAIKKIITQLGMEKYDYNGFDESYGVLYFTKKLDNDGNYNFASYKLMESGKDVLPSFGTKIDLLDKIMVDYLVNSNVMKSFDEMSEEIKPYYGTKIPTDITKNLMLKFYTTSGYEVLYVRDTTTHPNMIIKPIDVYLTKSNAKFVVIKHIQFIPSIDHAKTKKGNKFVETDGNLIVIPKNIIE